MKTEHDADNQANEVSEPHCDDNERESIENETPEAPQLNEMVPSNSSQQPSSVAADMNQYLHLSNTPKSARVKRENVETIVSCDECHSIFTTVQGLKSHKKAMHQGIKYSCDRCEYQANMQVNLKSHIENKHLGIRYSCDQCEYKATKPSHLRLHTESKHEGVKYTCNYCDFKSGWPQKLTNRQLRKHDRSSKNTGNHTF